MKNSYYFSHDYYARTDPKVSALINKYKWEGYGIWWCLVEIMHSQRDGKLEKFPHLYKGLAFELGINEALLQALINSLINDFRLLKEDDNFIWSDRVIRNIKELDDKRLQKVEAGRLGGFASGISRSKTKQNEAPLEANEQKESKVKESKVNKRTRAFDFESIWTNYPNKLGKKEALGHFNASVKTEQDYENMKKALDNFLNSKKAKGDPKYIPYGKTWFNNWRDWVEYKEPKKESETFEV